MLSPMRPRPSALPLLVVALGAIVTATSAAQFTFFKSVWGDVIVATDMTPEGRALTPPDLEKPVYYLGRSLASKLGSLPGERLPDVKETNDFVARVLAQQGYLAAKPGVHEPSLFLVVQWGYLDPKFDDLKWFLGYDIGRDIGAEVFPGLIGPEVFRRDFRSRTIDTVLDGMKGPIYGIIVTAFEYKSARTPNPVVYWQSRIGLPAQGKSMAEAVETMILAAGPSIGQESDGPVLRDADAARAGRVRLGDLKILDVVEQSPARGEK